MIFHLFWSKFDATKHDSMEAWANSSVEITPLHKLTLLAHAKLGHQVFLYSYQKVNIKNVPKGITLANASGIWDISYAYLAMQKGHNIAHISDLIRLKSAATHGGIVADMDAVVLRTPPDEGFFCSMPAKKTGGFAPKWGINNPRLIVHDGSWDGKALSCFPVSVDEKLKPYILKLTNVIEHSLKRYPKHDTKGWNYVMWALKRLPLLDKKYKVYSPLYFCPVPAWLSKGNCYSLEYPSRLDGITKVFGHTLPKIDDIMDKSYIVQHFFESAFKGAGVQYNLWQQVPNDCLLGREARFILGDNWRDILIKYA